MVHAAWSHGTIWEMVIKGRCQGQQIINVHHFEAAATLDAAINTDALKQAEGPLIAANWLTNCKAAYLDLHTNDYTLDEIITQVVEVNGQTNHVLAAMSTTTGLPSAGTTAAAADDMTTALNIKWRSLLAGKHRRGRSMMGPQFEGASLAGLVVAGSLTVMTAYRTAMARYRLTGAEALKWLHTVYSKPYNTGQYQYTKRVAGVLTVVTPTDYNGDSNNIVDSANDPILRVVRRREIGKGA